MTGNTVNLRAGPGTIHAVLASIENATQLTVLRGDISDPEAWLQVELTEPAQIFVLGEQPQGFILSRLTTGAMCRVPHDPVVATTPGSVVGGRPVTLGPWDFSHDLHLNYDGHPEMRRVARAADDGYDRFYAETEATFDPYPDDTAESARRDEAAAPVVATAPPVAAGGAAAAPAPSPASGPLQCGPFQANRLGELPRVHRIGPGPQGAPLAAWIEPAGSSGTLRFEPVGGGPGRSFDVDPDPRSLYPLFDAAGRAVSFQQSPTGTPNRPRVAGTATYWGDAALDNRMLFQNEDRYIGLGYREYGAGSAVAVGTQEDFHHSRHLVIQHLTEWEAPPGGGTWRNRMITDPSYVGKPTHPGFVLRADGSRMAAWVNADYRGTTGPTGAELAGSVFDPGRGAWSAPAVLVRPNSLVATTFAIGETRTGARLWYATLAGDVMALDLTPTGAPVGQPVVVSFGALASQRRVAAMADASSLVALGAVGQGTRTLASAVYRDGAWTAPERIDARPHGSGVLVDLVGNEAGSVYLLRNMGNAIVLNRFDAFGGGWSEAIETTAAELGGSSFAESRLFAFPDGRVFAAGVVREPGVAGQGATYRLWTSACR